MKLIITLLFLSLGALSYGQNASTCNIYNYKDYIDTPGSHQCYLRGASLWGANLTEANLRGADLRGANLFRAKLRSADLRGANLYKAKLRSADLRGANLFRANLSDANFTNAKVDPDLGAYLTSQGISGFVVENETVSNCCLF